MQSCATTASAKVLPAYFGHKKMYLDTYPVESGVPMPTARLGKYDWGRLAVSESLFVPVGDRKRRTLQDTVRGCAKAYGERHGVVFRWKMVATGIRVWRIL